MLPGVLLVRQNDSFILDINFSALSDCFSDEFCCKSVVVAERDSIRPCMQADRYQAIMQQVYCLCQGATSSQMPSDLSQPVDPQQL